MYIYKYINYLKKLLKKNGLKKHGFYCFFLGFLYFFIICVESWRTYIATVSKILFLSIELKLFFCTSWTPTTQKLQSKFCLSVVYLSVCLSFSLMKFVTGPAVTVLVLFVWNLVHMCIYGITRDTEEFFFNFWLLVSIGFFVFLGQPFFEVRSRSLPNRNFMVSMGYLDHSKTILYRSVLCRNVYFLRYRTFFIILWDLVNFLGCVNMSL